MLCICIFFCQPIDSSHSSGLDLDSGHYSPSASLYQRTRVPTRRHSPAVFTHLRWPPYRPVPSRPLNPACQLQAQRFTVTDRARCCGGSLSRRFHACICINSALDRYPRAGGVGARLYIYI